jgi:hypothetical protein
MVLKLSVVFESEVIMSIKWVLGLVSEGLQGKVIKLRPKRILLIDVRHILEVVYLS